MRIRLKANRRAVRCNLRAVRRHFGGFSRQTTDSSKALSEFSQGQSATSLALS
jgi:hypothetical protein